MNKPTLVDLFCGAGGISHGFEQAGFKVVGGVDFDHDSTLTFAANHSGARTLRQDLSKLSPEALAEGLKIRPGEIDCIAGGPPCQGFSRNRAFRHQDGVFVDDPRNHLYWHFFEFIRYLKPRFVIMENVPEILIKAEGYFQDAVIKKFQSLGYRVNAQVVNAAEYGVPQRRRRAIFLAALDNIDLVFPRQTYKEGVRPGSRTPTSKASKTKGKNQNYLSTLFGDPQTVGPTVWDAISDLHGVYSDKWGGDSKYASQSQTYYQRERRRSLQSVANHFPWQVSDRQLRRMRLLGEGQGWEHLPDELRTRDGYGSAYRRLQSTAQALTITTWMFHPGSGMFTHPFADRVITIREAARIQSFQDDFEFVGKYHSQCRQVGNSVAPLMAKTAAEEMLRLMSLPHLTHSEPYEQLQIA